LASIRDAVAERIVQQEALEWLRSDIGGSAWILLRLPVVSRRALSTATITLLFPADFPLDKQNAVTKFGLLRPMIENYLKLWQRMRTQSRGSEALRSALDDVDMGILVINKSGGINFANRSATEILDAGEHLRRIGDSFTAGDLHDALRLQVAITHVIEANKAKEAVTVSSRRAPLLSVRARGGYSPLVITIVPAPKPALEPHDCAAMAYILDPRLDSTTQLEPVCRLYGLSPVETRLVGLLTAGKSLQEAALLMGIKDQTARGYLKQVFLKTQTNRQADLVRAMLCSLVRIQRSIEPAFIDAGSSPHRGGAGSFNRGGS
jgi:DNA-binding CsgD family transcriptional regulator/PAS domain-containing protein